MKKSLQRLATIGILLWVGFLCSCRKESNNSSSESVLSIKDVSAIKTLLSSYKNGIAGNYQKWIDSLAENLNFQGAQAAPNSLSKKTLISIPITIPVLKNVSSNKLSKSISSQQSRLLVFRDQAGTIELANIVQLTPDGNSSLGNASKLISSLFADSGKSTNYSGYITSLDLERKFQWELKFDHGDKVSYSYKSKKAINSGNRTVTDDPNCTDTYIVYTLWIDGEPVAQEWDYIGTECFPPPGDGGGGGGGPFDDGACEQSELDSFNDQVSNSEAVSEQVSSSISVIDAMTQNKSPEWNIYQGPAGAWKIRSHEIGVVKLVDVPNNTWAWVSLVHGSMDLTGTTVPGTGISYTGTGTPSFTAQTALTSNILYGGMDLSYNITFTFICDCPVVKNAGLSVSKPGHAYTFWTANPYTDN